MDWKFCLSCGNSTRFGEPTPVGYESCPMCPQGVVRLLPPDPTSGSTGYLQSSLGSQPLEVRTYKCAIKLFAPPHYGHGAPPNLWDRVTKDFGPAGEVTRDIVARMCKYSPLHVAHATSLGEEIAQPPSSTAFQQISLMGSTNPNIFGSNQPALMGPAHTAIQPALMAPADTGIQSDPSTSTKLIPAPQISRGVTQQTFPQYTNVLRPQIQSNKVSKSYQRSRGGFQQRGAQGTRGARVGNRGSGSYASGPGFSTSLPPGRQMGSEEKNLNLWCYWHHRSGHDIHTGYSDHSNPQAVVPIYPEVPSIGAFRMSGPQADEFWKGEAHRAPQNALEWARMTFMFLNSVDGLDNFINQRDQFFFRIQQLLNATGNTQNFRALTAAMAQTNVATDTYLKTVLSLIKQYLRRFVLGPLEEQGALHRGLLGTLARFGHSLDQTMDHVLYLPYFDPSDLTPISAQQAAPFQQGMKDAHATYNITMASVLREWEKTNDYIAITQDDTWKSYSHFMIEYQVVFPPGSQVWISYPSVPTDFSEAQRALTRALADRQASVSHFQQGVASPPVHVERGPAQGGDPSALPHR